MRAGAGLRALAVERRYDSVSGQRSADRRDGLPRPRARIGGEEGLQALGLEYAADEKHLLPPLNAVKIPAGVDDLTGRKRLLEEFGIEVGGGLGDFKGKVWRIGIMGHNAREDNVLILLAALEQCLHAQGVKVPPGAGVAAANKVYAS